MNETEEEQTTKIRKSLIPLIGIISNKCAFFTVNLKTTHNDTIHAQYDNIEDFMDERDLQYLAYNWMRFEQLNENKSILFTYWVTKTNLTLVQEQVIAALTKILNFEKTNSWQIQLLTAKTEPFVMQSLFLTNNNYPQLVLPGLTCTKIGFSKTFNADMPTYFNQFNNYYYIWQKNNAWPYYQKELINLDHNVNTSELKKPITDLFDSAITTLRKKAHNRYHTLAASNQQPITYLTLANLVQTQTALSKNLAQIKDQPHYQPLVNYLKAELNA